MKQILYVRPWRVNFASSGYLQWRGDPNLRLGLRELKIGSLKNSQLQWTPNTGYRCHRSHHLGHSASGTYHSSSAPDRSGSASTPDLDRSTSGPAIACLLITVELELRCNPASPMPHPSPHRSSSDAVEAPHKREDTAQVRMGGCARAPISHHPAAKAKNG
jgi:hypothetical protein